MIRAGVDPGEELNKTDEAKRVGSRPAFCKGPAGPEMGTVLVIEIAFLPTCHHDRFRHTGCTQCAGDRWAALGDKSTICRATVRVFEELNETLAAWRQEIEARTAGGERAVAQSLADILPVIVYRDHGQVSDSLVEIPEAARLRVLARRHLCILQANVDQVRETGLLAPWEMKQFAECGFFIQVVAFRPISSAPAHRDQDAAFAEQGLIVDRAVLRPAVGMMNQPRRGVAGRQGTAQGFNGEVAL